MTGTHAIILGIVEGVTEFLPISSTFHLIWTGSFLRLPSSDFQKLFDVVIQSGAILAVVALFSRVLRQQPALIKKVIVAFLPTAVIGFLLYSFIKDAFFGNTILQIIAFLGVGILLLVFEYTHRRIPLSRSVQTISYREAFLVGIIQALAVIPGVSRAGAVMLALLYFHVRRDEAAQFSFLLAVPTILAASAFDLFQARSLPVTGQEFTVLAVGLVSAFVTALIVMKWLIRYLQSHTLAVFGWYRIIIVTIILLGWLL